MYLYEGGEMNAYNRHKTIEAQAQWQKESEREIESIRQQLTKE